MRPVAVFDADLPTGLAFIRSLGRAGVPVTAYSSKCQAMGRHSRFTQSFEVAPPFEATDEFVDWLAGELRSGAIGLVAPTSDFIAFNAAEAVERLDSPPDIGHPKPDRIRDCLLKNQFAHALQAAGFPTPETAAPSSSKEALEFVKSIGFPIVAKPRTHVGVGITRGAILRSDDDLHMALEPYELSGGHESALRHDPDLAWPLLQRLIERPQLEVLSVTGCLGPNGDLLALDHSKKNRQWPPGLGIGSLFEAIGPQPFTEHAVEAVKSVLGSGVFELEVLFDRASGDYWGIDLNPRGFGQIALDIARGNDLPRLWYESVTGVELPKQNVRGESVVSWQLGVPLFTDLLIGSAVGRDRVQRLGFTMRTLRSKSVGAAFDPRDPVPALILSLVFLRHPRGLVRPFLAAHREEA